jgi:hypothetical protein
MGEPGCPGERDRASAPRFACEEASLPEAVQSWSLPADRVPSAREQGQRPGVPELRVEALLGSGPVPSLDRESTTSKASNSGGSPGQRIFNLAEQQVCLFTRQSHEDLFGCRSFAAPRRVCSGVSRVFPAIWLGNYKFGCECDCD